jgi:hypothetical protein
MSPDSKPDRLSRVDRAAVAEVLAALMPKGNHPAAKRQRAALEAAVAALPNGTPDEVLAAVRGTYAP